MPVDPGQPERSGRFQGSNRSECGLHTKTKDNNPNNGGKESGIGGSGGDGRQAVHIPTANCPSCLDLTAKNLTELVQHTLDPLSDPSQYPPLLLEIYIPACSHCIAFAPVYERIAHLSVLQKQPIKVARVSFEEFDHVKGREKRVFGDVSGVPRVYLLAGKQHQMDMREQATRYTGDLSTEGLMKWLKLKSGGRVDIRV